MMETLPRIMLSRAEMMKRIARFKDLKGFDGGLPDSKMPGCERTLYNVIGFQPPKGKGGAVTSPSARMRRGSRPSRSARDSISVIAGPSPATAQ
jgi:hypothetical protein